jgi:hypothetical protein
MPLECKVDLDTLVRAVCKMGQQPKRVKLWLKRRKSPLMIKTFQPLTSNQECREIQNRLPGEAFFIQHELLKEALVNAGIRHFSQTKEGIMILGVFREDWIARFKDFLHEAPGVYAVSRNIDVLQKFDTLSDVYLYFRLYFSEIGIEVGQRFPVKIEVWSEDAGIVSYKGGGGGYTALPKVVEDSRLDVDLEKLSVLNTFSEKIQQPIDIVVLWVDGSDENWIKKRNHFLAESGFVGELPQSQFRDSGELQIALSSILNFMPWIRNVYIVTDSQKPNLSKFNSDKITLIDHIDFMPEYVALPTFNSHVISAFLHHIPGISKQFIVTNDDIFATRVVAKESFLTRNGIIKFNPTSSGISHLNSPGNSIPELARAQSHRMLSEYFERNLFPFRLKHVPITIDRDFMMRIENDFKAEFAQLAANRFRSKADFDPVYLYAYYAHEFGIALLQNSLRYEYIGTHSSNLVRDVERALNKGFDFFCLNDTLSEPTHDSIRELSMAIEILNRRITGSM